MYALLLSLHIFSSVGLPELLSEASGPGNQIPFPGHFYPVSVPPPFQKHSLKQIQIPSSSKERVKLDFFLVVLFTYRYGLDNGIFQRGSGPPGHSRAC